VRDGLLAAHRIGRHHRPLQVKHREPVRNGGHLIGFLGHRLLRQHPTGLPGKRTDEGDRRIFAVSTAAHGLAIPTDLFARSIR
jgi:hypothetical protein